jgi:hypothetical protein
LTSQNNLVNRARPAPTNEELRDNNDQPLEGEYLYSGHNPGSPVLPSINRLQIPQNDHVTVPERITLPSLGSQTTSVMISAQSIPHQQIAPSSISTGPEMSHSHAGDIDTGFLHVYRPEDEQTARELELEATQEPKQRPVSSLPQDLLESFAETYWDYCYPWCPVLDPDTLDQELAHSPLLANSLALAASHIRPPLVQHEGPRKYYEKARLMFYNDEEPNTLTALKALSLFYWWAPRAPSTPHRHSSWWWSSLIIRTAQQMNVHREPPEADPTRDRLQLSLRRRLWWTVFVSHPDFLI